MITVRIIKITAMETAMIVIIRTIIICVPVTMRNVDLKKSNKQRKVKEGTAKTEEKRRDKKKLAAKQSRPLQKESKLTESKEKFETKGKREKRLENERGTKTRCRGDSFRPAVGVAIVIKVHLTLAGTRAWKYNLT